MKARLDRDPKARRALLREAVQSLLDGNVDTGKAVLRDYINATVGFEELGKATGTPPQELDADVRSSWQPTSQESLRGDRPSSAQVRYLDRGAC